MVVGGVVAASAVGVGALALSPRDGHAVTGLVLEGVRVGEEADVRRVVREQATRWLDEEVWLEAGATTERLRRVEIGWRIDLDACVRDVLAIGRSGAWLADVSTRGRARLGQLSVSLGRHLDRDAVRTAIVSLASRYDREPIAAVLDEGGRVTQPAEAGRAIDVEASFVRVLEGLGRDERRITVVVQRTSAPVDARAISAQGNRQREEARVVGSYVTRYRMRGDEGPRAINVRVAAEALDGAVIAPGATLSFNERVGPRTEGRGYRVAHVIYDGEMVDGIGGGVCQVASTLHAAAFLAGLPIVAHVPHSRPSTYIPMGLDATVVYPAVDLVIGNTLEVPITVRAHADAGQLEIALWARARPLEVDWRREVLARTGYEERVVEDASVASGQARISQEGGPGFVVERVRSIEGVVSERRTLRYPPTDRVVRVAPGYSFDAVTGLAVLGVAAVPDVVSAGVDESAVASDVEPLALVDDDAAASVPSPDEGEPWVAPSGVD